MVLCLVHAFDDAFVDRQPGIALDQHLLAVLLAVALAAVAIFAFPASALGSIAAGVDLRRPGAGKRRSARAPHRRGCAGAASTAAGRRAGAACAKP